MAYSVSMVIAMLLAHLVGDYILQWDSLAAWKGRAVKGALVHGLIVTAVTWLFCLPFDPSWQGWALFIGLSHTAVDAVEVPLRRRLPQGGLAALQLFIVDQIIHLGVIFFALTASGYLVMPAFWHQLSGIAQDNRALAFLLAYAFVTLPAWILIEFVVFGLIKGSAPDFSQTTNKYIGSLERALMTTFVLLGQFVLIPAVALPRLIFEGPRIVGSDRSPVYIAQLLASVTIAVIIGLVLRQL
jgi:hypothetical protein